MSTLRTFNLQNPDSGTVNIEMDQGGNTLMTGIATVRGAAHFTSTSGSDAVGIGTDITAYKLDVRVTGAEAGLRVYNPDTSSNASGILRLGNDDNQNSAFLRLNGSNNTSAVGGAANLVLGTGTAREVHLATGGVSRFKITSGGVKQVLNGNLNIYQTYIDFSGDQSTTPNTAVALYRPADGTFAISTQNTERFRIRSDGRVTIGTQTINTNSMLSIHRSSSDESQIRFTNTTTGEGGNNGLLVGIDSNEHGRIFNQENQPLRFGTNNTERLRIDSVGKLLIGPGAIANPKVTTIGAIDTSNADWAIVMGGSGSGNRADAANKDGRFAGAHYTNAEEPIGLVRCYSTSSANEVHIGGGSSLINAATQLSFYTASNTTTTGGTERLRIDSNGRLLLGTSSNLRDGLLQVASASANTQIQITESSDAGGGPTLRITRLRGSNLGSPAPVQGGNYMGQVAFDSYDTGAYRNGAFVRAEAEQTWASGDCPTRLIIGTTADGASSPTERLRITSSGAVNLSTPSSSVAAGLLNVPNGSRVTTTSGVYVTGNGGIVDMARYEMISRCITAFPTYNTAICAINGAPLYINDTRDTWAVYSGLPNYLLGTLTHDCINNTSFNITLACTMTVFLLRSNPWNAVNLTGWTLIETNTNIAPAASDTRLYVKTLAAGTHTLDNDSALYFFSL